jgi:hypothetical protein
MDLEESNSFFNNSDFEFA